MLSDEEVANRFNEFTSLVWKVDNGDLTAYVDLYPYSDRDLDLKALIQKNFPSLIGQLRIIPADERVKDQMKLTIPKILVEKISKILSERKELGEYLTTITHLEWKLQGTEVSLTVGSWESEKKLLFDEALKVLKPYIICTKTIKTRWGRTLIITPYGTEKFLEMVKN